MESSATKLPKVDEANAVNVDSPESIVNKRRQRRQQRLELIAGRNNARARSPQTLYQHQSMDFQDKLLLAAATADTAQMSTGSPDTHATDHSTQVGSKGERLYPSFERGGDSIPCVTTANTFPSPEISQIPNRIRRKNNSASTITTSEDSSPALHDNKLKRERGQDINSSVTDERQPQGGERHVTPFPIISSRLLPPSIDEVRLLPKQKPPGKSASPSKPSAPTHKTTACGSYASNMSRPNLQRYSTAPSSSSPARETNVLDNVLMDRAWLIRQNLMSFEMQELAEEAEKAAESGLEKFVGSASKFGVEETSPYLPQFADDGDFVSSRERGDEYLTPSRMVSRKSFVDTLPDFDYTPSYFTRKKIPVTALRKFDEIVPTFTEMHNNIRIHLGSEGMDTNLLPAVHTRQSDDDGNDCEEGLLSPAPSFASSFSSYAVASFREIIDHGMSTFSRPESDTSTKLLSNSVDEENGNPSQTELNHSDNSDSDDSSVEYYGRKSPVIELFTNNSATNQTIPGSSQSVTSNLSARNNTNQSFPESSRSVTSNSAARNNIKQTFSESSRSVTFAKEKETYRALLERMRKKTLTKEIVLVKSESFDVDQTSCAPSLTGIFPVGSDSETNITSPMAFLAKLQSQFSLTSDNDGCHNDMPLIDENNKHFVSNYFYTSQKSGVINPDNDTPTLNFDTNQDERKNSKLLRGCGPENIISACDTATRYADRIFDWFGGGGESKAHRRKATNSSIEQSPNPNWIQSWQTSEAEDYVPVRQIFLPPKLSAARHAVENNEGKESTNLAYDCESSIIACSDVGELSCQVGKIT